MSAVIALLSEILVGGPQVGLLLVLLLLEVLKGALLLVYYFQTAASAGVVQIARLRRGVAVEAISLLSEAVALQPEAVPVRPEGLSRRDVAVSVGNEGFPLVEAGVVLVLVVGQLVEDEVRRLLAAVVLRRVGPGVVR